MHKATSAIKKIYGNIIQAICRGDSNTACLQATHLIVKETKIENRFNEAVLASLNKIRNLRGSPLLKK